MKTFEQYLNENLDKFHRLNYADNKFKVCLYGKKIILNGRNSREKSVKGIGKTPTEAFENALNNYN